MNLLTRFLHGTTVTWAPAVTGPAIAPASPDRRATGLTPGLPAGPVTGAAPKVLGEDTEGAAHL